MSFIITNFDCYLTGLFSGDYSQSMPGFIKVFRIEWGESSAIADARFSRSDAFLV